jgi:hypothetical protein
MIFLTCAVQAGDHLEAESSDLAEALLQCARFLKVCIPLLRMSWILRAVLILGVVCCVGCRVLCRVS